MISYLWRRALGIRRRIRNLLFDARYGGFSGEFGRTRRARYCRVVNTDYALMPQIFAGRIRADDVLVDVGCGRGRVINWWLDQGHRGPIIGLELLEDVAASTRSRLKRFANVTIVSGDAIANLPPEGTLFFLFNPFGTVDLTRRFIEQFAARFTGTSGVRIIFYACIHVECFKQDPRWDVEEVELQLPSAGAFEERHRMVAYIKLREPAV